MKCKAKIHFVLAGEGLVPVFRRDATACNEKQISCGMMKLQLSFSLPVAM